MTFKTKLVLIAVLPLILVSVSVAAVIYYQAVQLSDTEIAAVEQRIIASKRQSLENYISLALTSIDHIYRNEVGGREKAQEDVKRILHDMTFGEDGYFFVYDQNGTLLAHPKLTHLVGKNLWDLQDPNGDYAIRNLIRKAKAGGGFHRYVWEKPSLGKPADKLGYSVFLDKWGWMVGTGLYIDDIARDVNLVKSDIRTSIRETFQLQFVITLFAVILVALSIFGIKLSEQRLADSKLKELTNRLVDVQEEERKRVSTELHDGISQLLVSVRYTLDLIANNVKENRESVEPLIKKSMGILESAITEVRRISKDLRPSVLDDIGLSAAIESLGKEFAEQSGIQVDVNPIKVGDLLTPEAKTTLYRVAQEALTNVARHAGAQHVDIRLELNGKTLLLQISDDGVGIDRSTTHAQLSHRSGLGIRNMRERVVSHGGKLQVRSSGSGGTEIRADMPLSTPAVQLEPA